MSFGAVLASVVLLPALAGAQPLAAVARSEEARRKELPKGSKVYTNADLTRDRTTPTPPATAAAASGAPAEGGSAAAPPPPAEAPAPPAADTPVRDEKYWRERIGAARAELERSRTFADALQSRISALTTDFVNRDDPAQRSLIDSNRLKALAELERVQREIAAHTKTIAAIEDEARRARVPAGWLR